MGDILRKGLLTAIGTASFAAKNADKILRGVAKKGLISTKDARSLLKKLVIEAEREKKRVQKILSDELKKQVKKTRPTVGKGKKAISRAKGKGKKAIYAAKRKGKTAVSKAGKRVRSAQRTAEKRGKDIVRKAAKRLR